MRPDRVSLSPCPDCRRDRNRRMTRRGRKNERDRAIEDELRSDETMRYTVTVTDETGSVVGTLLSDLEDSMITEVREEHDQEMSSSGIDETMSLTEAIIYLTGPEHCPFDCGHCHS